MCSNERRQRPLKVYRILRIKEYLNLISRPVFRSIRHNSRGISNRTTQKPRRMASSKVHVSTSEIGNGRVSSPKMLPKQGVLKTKGQEKSDVKLCQDSVRKAKGISSTAHNKAADPEDDLLRLRKIKLQLENSS